jgi:DNA repair protein SbcC/Rad50
LKLERLRVRGLRSYTSEVEIDLARLGEEGLFAIVGPTGSGKSTILDGIFLALFGRCPRGEPGECVSSGALELDVRLEIEIEIDAGSDELPRPLAIERCFRWVKKRADSPTLRGATRRFSLQIKERIAGAWTAVNTGGREPEDYLREEIVRVSMKDFQRAVVLPQGQFDALLRARPAERRTLLASLFRTEHLGQPLYDALRARGDEVEREREHLDDDARGAQVTPEDLEAARADLAIARAEASAADEALHSLDAHELSLRDAFAARSRAVSAAFAAAAAAARDAELELELEAERARDDAAAIDRAASRDEHLRACLARIADARARIDEARAAFDHLAADPDARDHRQERDAARADADDASARAAQAAARCEELDRRAHRTLELHARAALLEPRARRLAQIRQIVMGNQLAELAADRHLEAVTRGAADLLRTLSVDRYSLVRNAEGAFEVADSLLGGVIRATSTLSGGEAFLVSLALALALSERIQLAGRTRFDFFFLDEGFGGLDAVTLDTAISALERLRGPHRVIGMISHLAAVEERMPRKLRVQPSHTGTDATVLLEVGERPREAPRAQALSRRKAQHIPRDPTDA